jgi:integrase
VLGESRRIYSHLFRLSFVTEQLRRGMQPILVAKIVGHSSLEMVSQSVRGSLAPPWRPRFEWVG